MKLIVPDGFSGRLDVFLASQLGASRSHTQKIIDSGVTIDGKLRSKSFLLSGGETVEYEAPETKELSAEPQNIDINIIYEDECLLVVDKPKGLVVHPAPGNEDGTLVNALLYHCSGRLSSINGTVRPGIVHRIDKDTSGLLVVAKTDEAHISLAAQIASHSFGRAYEGICVGRIKEQTGTVDKPIGRHPTERKRMAVRYENSKNAVTHYSIIQPFERFTHMRFELETGRTHQIRVHLASIGHPIAGDTLYGDRENRLRLQGQCLFAAEMSFVHPKSGGAMFFRAQMPSYFTETLEKLKN